MWRLGLFSGRLSLQFSLNLFLDCSVSGIQRRRLKQKALQWQDQFNFPACSLSRSACGRFTQTDFTGLLSSKPVYGQFFRVPIVVGSDPPVHAAQ